MRFSLATPLDENLARWWSRVDPAYKKAFVIVLGVNLLAFGFEMTNLTINHDDVGHILIEDDIIGHYIGRFGLGRLHYFAQNAYVMPFLQMLEAMSLMIGYGLVLCHLWGVRKTMDMILVTSIVSVFPYAAQMYSYNAAMVPFAMSHLLVAVAVLLSTKARAIHLLVAAILYVAAFSIYQSVLANAATVFCVWALAKVLFDKEPDVYGAVAKSTISVVIAVVAGGLLYVGLVNIMNIDFDSYQRADEAFTLSDGLKFGYSAEEMLKGTRSFFFWAQNYFPGYLKKLQLIFLLAAALVCLWLPKRLRDKVAAMGILAAVVFAPRTLQLLHPDAVYHNMTLTAYAVAIAAFVMIVFRAGSTILRNLSAIVAFGLIAGYVMQCNWMSTVNYLNTLAHYTTMTQILARVRAIPTEEWDGERIVVVGNYHTRMPRDYPYRPESGVAPAFLNASRMQSLARLMRENVTFVPADQAPARVLESAANRPPWPHPRSVGVVDGVGVVILSDEH